MVAAVDMPGTESVDLPGQDFEPRYTLDATVWVSSGLNTEIDQVRTEVRETSPFGRLSVTAGNHSLSISSLSITQDENVELTYTLHGPIDEPRTFTDDLGDLSRLKGESVQSHFTPRNLPCGNYVLHMDLYSDGGHDYHREDVQIACRGDNR